MGARLKLKCKKKKKKKENVKIKDFFVKVLSMEGNILILSFLKLLFF